MPLVMNRKITIDPVTRVEGHGRVTIHLDEYGQVKDSFSYRGIPGL